jgi:hypothetical protein
MALVCAVIAGVSASVQDTPWNAAIDIVVSVTALQNWVLCRSPHARASDQPRLRAAGQRGVRHSSLAQAARPRMIAASGWESRRISPG